jgi:four helix bundle protein
MRDPKRLQVVEWAAKLGEMTYRVTRDFPADERFGLVSQMRRAAISVGSNICEGCGYSTDRAFLNYVHIAIGSLSELEYQAMMARRLCFGSDTDLIELAGLALRLKRMLFRLASAIRRRKAADSASSTASPRKVRAQRRTAPSATAAQPPSAQ